MGRPRSTGIGGKEADDDQTVELELEIFTS